MLGSSERLLNKNEINDKKNYPKHLHDLFKEREEYEMLLEQQFLQIQGKAHGCP